MRFDSTKHAYTYRKFLSPETGQLCPDVDRGFLERWWGIEVIVLKGVEVEDAVHVVKNILAQRLVEWE